MRFASVAIAFTLATKSNGFVPTTDTSAIHGLSNSGYIPVIYQASTVSSSTSLSLFSSATRAARKFNAPAKSDGAPTEKEVRALFELWNSALATGDSKIVASRYTKVSSFH
jgi:hypothetical protein